MLGTDGVVFVAPGAAGLDAIGALDGAMYAGAGGGAGGAPYGCCWADTAAAAKIATRATLLVKCIAVF